MDFWDPMRFSGQVGFLPAKGLEDTRTKVWQDRPFRHLLWSDGLAALGGYLFLLILPGLVVGSGSEPAWIGVAILSGGAARIGLMALGGLLSDRFSPWAMARVAYAGRAVLQAMLCGYILSAAPQRAAVLGFCFVYGISEALLIPARAALLPRVLRKDELPQANAVAAGFEKLIGLGGPILAGFLLAVLDRLMPGAGRVPLAFGLAVQVVLLMGAMVSVPGLSPGSMRAKDQPAALNAEQAAPGQMDNPLAELGRLIWRRKNLRSWLMLVCGFNLLSVGPVCIGLPILAASRFAGSPGVLGLWMSAGGGGAVLGAAVCGLVHRSPSFAMAKMILLVFSLLSAGLLTLCFSSSVAATALAAFGIGCLGTFVNIIGGTQVQLNTPPAFMGRMMVALNLK